MIIDALLQIRGLMLENDELVKLIPFVIKHKSQNEKARFEKLLCYELDDQTLDDLEQNHKDWMTDPSLFTNKIKSSEQAVSDPWTRAISEYLDTAHDNV